MNLSLANCGFIDDRIHNTSAFRNPQSAMIPQLAIGGLTIESTIHPHSAILNPQ